MAVGLTPKEQRRAQNIIGSSQAAARVEAAGKRPAEKAQKIMLEANLRLREARLAPGRASARVEEAGRRFAERAPIKASGYQDVQGRNEQELARREELEYSQNQARLEQAAAVEQAQLEQDQAEQDLANMQAQVGATTAAEQSRRSQISEAKGKEEQMETTKSYVASGLEGTEGTTSSSAWMAWLDTIANAIWQVIRFMRTLIFKDARGFMGIIAKLVPEYKLPQMAIGFAIIGAALVIMTFMGAMGMVVAVVFSNPYEAATQILPHDLRMTLLNLVGQIAL